MTLDQCYATYVGQSVSYDGIEANRGQCVQWVEIVHTQVYGAAPFYGNAIDWWNNYSGSLVTTYTRTQDGIIKKGDLVVFNQKVGSVYGHIDVAMSDGDYNNFQGSDMNWNGNKTVHLVQHVSASYILGVLRPRSSNQGAIMGVPDQDNWYNRFNKLMYQIRGREMSRDEFRKAIVPARDPFNGVEILSDSSEADAATNAQQVGQQAIRENWKANLDLLTKDRDTNLYPTINDLRAKLDATNKQVADVTSENATLKQELAEEDAQIKDPNKIIITNKGWSAVWVALQSFFNKNN